jgi:putative membrane protein
MKSRLFTPGIVDCASDGWKPRHARTCDHATSAPREWIQMIKPAATPTASPRFVLGLLVAFTAIWTALALAPWYREDWLLENVLVFIALPLLAWGYRTLPFTRSTYACLFAFLVLHEIGAHYTYSEVPYDRAFEAVTGASFNALLGWERNHYDRVVHFLYGLLVTPAAIEILQARATPRGLWRWLLPVCFMMSHSVLYETIEWFAAEVFGGDLGQAYLGTQGDVWDAQKDSLLATAGSLLAVILCTRRIRPGPVQAAGGRAAD